MDQLNYILCDIIIGFEQISTKEPHKLYIDLHVSFEPI